MSFDASLLVIMGIFWITYVILRVFFFSPMMRLLDERETRVSSAQTIYDEALNETAKSIDEERTRLAEARREAMAQREQQRREAQDKRLAMLSEVKTQVQGELNEARLELESQVAHERQTLGEKAQSIARQMAANLLGRPA